ncbi:hypothetical protein [Candidatus Burkholderia verschuerenii]|uniref:hypothetical protein n=1 Tax=Candidatus Burkholderia verschuerenii TaxID=242163 RepID=UPI001E2EBD15|nr:hypothetical protein [Candidatus Burkholderia verschuerenii]
MSKRDISATQTLKPGPSLRRWIFTTLSRPAPLTSPYSAPSLRVSVQTVCVDGDQRYFAVDDEHRPATSAPSCSPRQ